MVAYYVMLSLSLYYISPTARISSLLSKFHPSDIASFYTWKDGRFDDCMYLHLSGVSLPKRPIFKQPALKCCKMNI